MQDASSSSKAPSTAHPCGIQLHRRMPRPVLPCGMRQPGQETDAGRSEALAGNPARLPRGNVAGAHAPVLDQLRRGRRSRGHGDRATGCRFDRPAQRFALEGPRNTRRCERRAFAWRRSALSSTRGSSHARWISSLPKARAQAPSAHSNPKPSRSRIDSSSRCGRLAVRSPCLLRQGRFRAQIHRSVARRPSSP